MRRWREKLEEHRCSGLAGRRKGEPTDKRVPIATAEKVLKLFHETYYDLNMRTLTRSCVKNMTSS
jgi:hypothetical protein